MATSVLVNGIDMGATYGLWLEAAQWRSVPPISRQRFPISNRAGLMFAAPARIGIRDLVLSGSMRQDTLALELSNEDAARTLLTAGLVRVALSDGSAFSRLAEGFVEKIEVTPLGPSLAPLASRWSIALACPTPYWQNAEPTIRGLTSTSVRYTLPLGTAPSTPIIRIMGSATTPLLTYRDAGGATVKTLTFPTLGASDWIDADMRTGVITKYVSGSPSVELNITGDYPWAFDSQDGDWATQQWPTLQVSAGTAVAYWWNSYL